MKYLVNISKKNTPNSSSLLCVLNELTVESKNDILDLKIITKLANNHLLKIEVVEDTIVNELQANMIFKGFSTYPQGGILTLYKSVLTYMFHIDPNKHDLEKMINEFRTCKNDADVGNLLEKYKLKTKIIRL